ncbi:MAG: hypothetical protein JWL81_1675 [Verrucomicrobiales bacterium]|nr:hypothetical protein [Verrucomicrobiales bacterium]
MTDRELDSLMRRLPPALEKRVPDGAGDFSEGILARLSAVRFVVPGSTPGRKVVAVAGMLALVTAALIAWAGRGSEKSETRPPPLTLFQSGQAESFPAPSTP